MNAREPTRKLLEIRNLTKHYPILGGVLRRPVAHVRAVDGIDLDIYRGECLGLVGESGCGKTTAGKAMVRLHDPTGGRMLYFPGKTENGKGKKSTAPVDITSMKARAMKSAGIRHRLQMVFQDPATSLNPRMLVKHIVAEPIRAMGGTPDRAIEDRVAELLGLVGLTRDHLLRYPHEFSGGQRQRIAVARAIATNPEFIVLDEPTSALDVSVQAQMLNLLKSLQDRLGLTYLFVTHHLLVVRYISHRMAVMYLGKISEIGDTKDIFDHPRHPYTHALLSGIPIPDVEHKTRRIVLSGEVPSPLHPPEGCRFHTRCPFVIERCRVEEPFPDPVAAGHWTACHRKHEVEGLVRDRFGGS